MGRGEPDLMADEAVRLRLIMAAALERAEVGDADEAAFILAAVVRLDGSPR